MVEVATNCDLYGFITQLVEQRSECPCTLQSYLENLRRLGHELRAREAISPDELAELLRAAFAPEPSASSAFGASSASDADPAATAGYLAWEKRIDEQIRDLDEMRRAGTLDDEHRHFGVDAPRGGRWNNLDLGVYLECAVAGTFGGWQQGNDTGRSLVPGSVAVPDASGAISSMDPRDIDDGAVVLPQITWQLFVDFLDAGQWHE